MLPEGNVFLGHRDRPLCHDVLWLCVESRGKIFVEEQRVTEKQNIAVPVTVLQRYTPDAP